MMELAYGPWLPMLIHLFVGGFSTLLLGLLPGRFLMGQKFLIPVFWVILTMPFLEVMMILGLGLFPTTSSSNS